MQNMAESKNITWLNLYAIPWVLLSNRKKDAYKSHASHDQSYDKSYDQSYQSYDQSYDHAITNQIAIA